MTRDAYDLRFPPDYESEEWIWTSKGYLVVELEVHGPTPARYSLTFRDPTRLSQDVEAELADQPVFAEPNVLVVPTVDRASVDRAVEELASRGFHGLVAD
jgi:hypothetical protein